MANNAVFPSFLGFEIKTSEDSEPLSIVKKSPFLKYSLVLLKRIYRPVKPIVDPLLKKIKICQALGLLVGIGLIGSLSNGWIVIPQERVSWWPWSSKAHSEMAIAWLKDGNENNALNELKIANKLFFIKTRVNKKSLAKANNKVAEPKKIRQEIELLEKTLKTMPYSKDILLRLVILNYQLYENKKAKIYLEEAEYLDPNDEETLKIKEIVDALN